MASVQQEERYLLNGKAKSLCQRRFTLKWAQRIKGPLCFIFSTLGLIIVYVHVLPFIYRRERASHEPQISSIIAKDQDLFAMTSRYSPKLQPLSMKGGFQTTTNPTVDAESFFEASDSLAMDDTRLIKYLREKVLRPPSNLPYNLTYPEAPDLSDIRRHTSEHLVPNYFSYPDKKRSGVFIEAGALDGEWLSTTLYLERYLGWTGLLAEMTPMNVEKLLKKNRKSWIAPVCLSPKPYPVKLKMNMQYIPGNLTSTWGASVVMNSTELNRKKDPRVKRFEAEVPCYPLYSLMLAANVTVVDLLSLDVEGAELSVLKTIPWHLVTIRVILIDLVTSKQLLFDAMAYLKSVGYMHSGDRNEPIDSLIFLHKDYKIGP